LIHLSRLVLCSLVALSALTVNGQSRVLKLKTNEKTAAAFNTGRLPEPLRKPNGTIDQVAGELAKTVAAGDDQSVPALLTGLMTAGFGIRDNDGAVTQTVEPGQGLIFEAWEIAAIAKMYGERRTVELSYLSDGIRSVPELKQAPLEKIILDGIRKHATSSHAELRFWARFIIELGLRSEQPYDLLRTDSDKKIRIDAIQSALILRRLTGDIYVLGKRSQVAVNNLLPKINFSHASQAQPCRQSDMEATINDIRATALTSAFDGLMSWVESRIGSSGVLAKAYGKFMSIANVLLAYAKFIATYAALETEITITNPPLVRVTTAGSGQSRQLTAKVSMNIGKWQQVNCFRWLLNAGTGLDFNLLNDGPLEGVGVNWHIVQGGFAGAYHSGDMSQQIVQFKGTGPRIQDAGTYAGIPGKGGTPVGNLTETKTDAEGNARILLEGAHRRNYIPKPHIPVMKKAVVMTTVRLKGGDIKGDAVDVMGHLLGGLLTIPAELLYRTDWASTAQIEVPVKDFESCDGGWYGTVTYVEHRELNLGKFETGTRNHSETIEVTGNTSISQGHADTTQIYENPTKVGKGCSPMFRRHFFTGDEQRTANVRVVLDGQGSYTLFVNVPSMQIMKRSEISACGHGNKEDMTLTETSNGYGLAVNNVEGKVDPENPIEISGTFDVADGAKLKWNLRRCQ
jgi:hypothetical protein